MTDLPDHFCPGCGAAQRAFARYPWYFCQDCLESARVWDGRVIRFGNAGLSGGLEWRIDGDDTVHDVQPVICLIAGRPAMVREARFGGVVAEPVPDQTIWRGDAQVANLTRRFPEALLSKRPG